ncbi:hypothetical protein [Ensifer aridi]|uniref:hypothetical protein n=1 Tax=Ensifer aridi TaxID=1708715 RepID=UPI000A108D2C|nr:hypothetical protein [Ensifer aridi]
MASKSNPTLAKRLILVTNNKGGVGKSVVSRALADLYRSNRKPADIYDGDGGVGSLLTAYGTRDEAGRLLREQDPAVGVGYYDIRSESTRNTLLDSLGSGASIVMHDLAGGSLPEIKRIIDDGDGVDGFLKVVERHGYRLTLLHVLSNVQGATASVKEYLEVFGDRADHIAIINQVWGKRTSDFPFWFGYDKPDQANPETVIKVGGNTRAALLKNGAEIEFPSLQPGAFAKVENLNIPYSKAVENKDLSVTENGQLESFIERTQAAFLQVANKLGM